MEDGLRVALTFLVLLLGWGGDWAFSWSVYSWMMASEKNVIVPNSPVGAES